MTATAFVGFPEDTLAFLEALKQNNERPWFEQQRERYEQSVREPALAFITGMQPRLKKISPYLEAVARKSGGSLMRIHRDTRFSNDKTPYKTNVGIQFKHEAGLDVHSPGCYVHLAPDEVFLAVGIWQPDSQSLRAIREAIANDPAAWNRAAHSRRFQEHFHLAGDSLKRPPTGFDKDHPLIEDLKRKDLMGVCPLTPADLKSPQFLDLIGERIAVAKPMLRFLCDALELPF